MSKLQDYPDIANLSSDDKVLIIKNNTQGLAKISDLPIQGATLDAKTVTENGTYPASEDNLDGYSSVTVNVPEPDIEPKSITQNGTYNAEDDHLDGYSSVTVNVTKATLGSKTINQNGTYSASSDGVDGYSQVVVETPTPTVDSKIITANGIYVASDDDLAGYSAVNVNVPGATLVSKTITENGTYNASYDQADGYSSVEVNVEGSSYTDLMALLASASEAYTGSSIIQINDTTVNTDSTILPSYIGQGKCISEVSIAKIIEVRKYAFYRTFKLTNINLPNCINIGSYAFSGIPYNEANEVTISLPKVKTIGSNAFDGSKVAVNISLPECETIGSNAFESCTKMRGIDLPKVKAIGTYAFSLCSITADVNLPLIETIGESAFSRGVDCTNFVIGPNCTSIGQKVFYDADVVNLYVHAVTPPTFGGFGYAANVSHIYVPAASVAAYQAAQNWSSYASIIEAMPT